MQHSKQPYIELQRARRAVDAMRTAESLHEIEDHWKEFLHRIERVWTKSFNHFGKSPKWPNWHGKYVQLRRKDDLLSQLINARGADEHTVSEITQQQQPQISVRVRPGQSLYIKKLDIDENGMSVVDYSGNADVKVVHAKVTPISVTNRGVAYPAPRVHLSQQINSENLADIAELGLIFYTNFLDSAERFFVESAPHSSEQKTS